MPELIEVISRPATSGSILSPDAVASTPSTYWRNVGRKVIAPSIVKPTTNASAEQTAKTFLVNRLIGRIGSSARSSTRTNTASPTAPPTKRPMMVAEPQAYVEPPQLVARIRQLVPRPTVRMPSQSIRLRAPAATLGMNLPAAKITIRANGTLM